MTIIFALVLSVASFVSSWLLTAVILKIAKRLSIVDHPNSRSSHTVATPRGGGLGIVVVVLGAIVSLYFAGQLSIDVFASLVVGGVLVAGIGLVDDYKHVPARWRFLVQMVAAIFAMTILGGLPLLQVGGQFIDLGLVGDVAAIIFAVWFINLYNFMDGIDGIAAVEAICIAGSAFVILSLDDGGAITNLLVVFAATTLGFLVWNWPPAKIFMGDVGSGFVGFILAMFALTTSSQGLLPIWCWLVLAGVFVVDATVTLITRMINGERWYSAHNNHAYQKASRHLNGHRPVTVAVLVINILWLLPIAWYASARPEFGWWLTLIAWTPLISLSLLLKAGRSEPSA